MDDPFQDQLVEVSALNDVLEESDQLQINLIENLAFGVSVSIFHVNIELLIENPDFTGVV